MASGLTPIYSIPYPLLTDNVNVHGDMEDLAFQVEQVLNIKADLNSTNLFTSTSSYLVQSTAPAIKITQTGIGAALLVEDESSVDATPFIVDQFGRVGIGIASPEDVLHVANGAAIFDAAIFARSGLQVGAADNLQEMTVYGNFLATTTAGSDLVYSYTGFEFVEQATNFKATLTRPTGLTENISYLFPAASGTVITTGNPNDFYPIQTSNAGKVLTTDGTNVSWQDSPNQVPDVVGQSGKYLSTDGSTYFWQDLLLIPALDPTPDLGTTGKWLTNNGEQVIWDFLPGDEPFIEITEDIVLSVGANLFCDTRGGNISITMPTNPLPGATVSVFDTQDFFQSNYVIIKPGAEKINGIEGDLILDVGGATVVFIYINETIGWRVA